MRAKLFIFAFLVLANVCYADPPKSVTSVTQRHGSGFITRRSDGSRVTTQRFGSGFISRETYRGGSATHTTQRFGSGFITRSRYVGVRR